jgi:hypothetical protein
MDFRQSVAAILLAPVLYHCVCLAQHVEAPAWEDCAYADRDAWVELADQVIKTIQDYFQPKAASDDALFRDTAEMTRKHFAAIRGGKA